MKCLYCFLAVIISWLSVISLFCLLAGKSSLVLQLLQWLLILLLMFTLAYLLDRRMGGKQGA